MVQTLGASLVYFLQHVLGELYHLLHDFRRRLEKRDAASEAPPGESHCWQLPPRAVGAEREQGPPGLKAPGMPAASPAAPRAPLAWPSCQPSRPGSPRVWTRSRARPGPCRVLSALWIPICHSKHRPLRCQPHFSHQVRRLQRAAQVQGPACGRIQTPTPGTPAPACAHSALAATRRASIPRGQREFVSCSVKPGLTWLTTFA